MLFVDLLDVIGIVVDVLHAFKVEFGQEKPLEALNVVIGNDKVFPVDLLLAEGENITLHQH